MTDVLSPKQPETLPQLQDADVPAMAARIMSVALELFAQQGYAATSVREIVQKADVTNPMLYYYFKSKAGLFAELLDHLFSTMQDDVTEALDSAEGLADKLEAIVWMHLDACRQSPIALKFVYSVLFGPENSRPQTDFFTQHVRVVGIIVQVFEQAIDSGEFVPRQDYSPLFLTHQYFGLINSLLMRTLTLTESIKAAEQRRGYLDELLSHEEGSRLVAFFLNGAGRIVE
jgi:AcrR family transcriptional regulator